MRKLHMDLSELKIETFILDPSPSGELSRGTVRGRDLASGDQCQSGNALCVPATQLQESCDQTGCASTCIYHYSCDGEQTCQFECGGSGGMTCLGTNTY